MEKNENKPFLKKIHSMKLLLLTGFLGSGKTTLLKRLIEHFSEQKIAVMMNEFGDIDVDGQILGEKDFQYKEISGGSIFCSCRHDQFIDTIIFLAKKKPDYIIVESSGISDPFQFYDDLKIIYQKSTEARIQYLGAISILDSLNFFEVYEATETIKRQIAFSDYILINKMDLVDQDKIDEILQIVKIINPDANTTGTQHCKLTEDMLSTLETQFTKRKIEIDNIDEIRNENLTKPENAPERVLLNVGGEPPKAEKVIAFLKEIISISYRIKGYLQTDKGMIFVNCVFETLQWDIVENINQNQGIAVIFKENIDYTVADSVKEGWSKAFNG